jgi:hypothetical protein
LILLIYEYFFRNVTKVSEETVLFARVHFIPHQESLLAKSHLIKTQNQNIGHIEKYRICWAAEYFFKTYQQIITAFATIWISVFGFYFLKKEFSACRALQGIAGRSYSIGGALFRSCRWGKTLFLFALFLH